MADTRPLLERLLNTPDLAKIVPQLQPEILHRVIQSCGLESSAEFIALATPAQLTRVLDLDIWQARRPGFEEEFDADRFGIWLEVLLEAGEELAADKLAGLDLELVTVGLSRHVRVFDGAAVSTFTTLDGERADGRVSKEPTSEIGGYLIEARRRSAWQSIIDLLAFLAGERADFFHRVMRGCVRLSNGLREADGFHDLLQHAEQSMYDLARDRESRRDGLGFVAPVEARAFLQSARQIHLDRERPEEDELARAYFRTVKSTVDDDEPDGASEEVPPNAIGERESEVDAHAVAAVMDVLRDAGVVSTPRALLGGRADGSASRFALVRAHLQTEPTATEELAYLANTILAGCAIQGRAFTPQEASDAAAATCNLGLEHWPRAWGDVNLAAAFRVGWTVLYRDVLLYAAEALSETLATIECADRDVQLPLYMLRRDLVQQVQRCDWTRVRTALEVIMILDMPAWAALSALIDECPTLHAVIGAARRSLRTVSPADVQFISQNSQIKMVHEFVASLPTALTL